MADRHATTYGPSSGARFLTRDPLEALTRSAYGYVGNNPINVTDPTGLAPWDGLVDFFVGSGCDGDGFFGDPGAKLASINWANVAHGLATGLSYVSFIPTPLGTLAAGASAVLFAASGDYTSASTMLVVAALGVGGARLYKGIDRGLEQSVRGLADDVVRIRPWMANTGKTAVHLPRYAVGVSTTDWSWLTGGQDA